MPIEILLGSDQERPHLFAELRTEGQAFADVIYDHAKEAYMVTLYPWEDGKWLTVDAAELRKTLERAKNLLVERGFPDITV